MSMPSIRILSRQPQSKKLLALLIWLGACYALRFYLMENPHWVEVCDGKTGAPACALRAEIGVIIHFRILPWLALALAIPGFALRGARGRALAWLSLIAALPALVLYTVTPAVFALLIAALRLVRSERHSASASSSDVAAQPSA